MTQRPVETGRYQTSVNDALWSRDDVVGAYAHRELRPAEVMLFVRKRDDLSKRVLELGCGAGRLTGYLVALEADVHAVDVSQAMIDEAARLYPQARFEHRDIRDLAPIADGSYDTVLAGFGVLDVLDDEERRRVIAEVHRLLVPGGALMFSTHNRAAADRRETPTTVRRSDPARFVYDLLKVPRRWVNHMRRSRHEVETPKYAILNDISHDFEALHYYVGHDAQDRQLQELGFSVELCLALDGRRVGPGGVAPDSGELHFVARK